MYNDEILNRLKSQFGVDETIKFCEMISVLYSIKHSACKNDNCRQEYDFEMQWWSEAGLDLIEKQDGKVVSAL